MIIIARLSGRIYFNFACPECGQDFKVTFLGNFLVHKKNHCMYSDTKWEYEKYPQVEIPVDVTLKLAAK